MNASLYVEKADGDRQMLDDVGMDMARDVFVKMDWDTELAAVKTAELNGTDVFLPEFGLTDEAMRMLVISPLDSDTVSFYVQYPDRVVGTQSFPRSDAGRLIGLYYQGLDDDIAALTAKAASTNQIPIRELSDAEFRATIVQPMPRLGDEQSYGHVHMRDYLDTCIHKFSLPVTLDTLELTDVYVAGDLKHSHIHFHYGDEPTTLVLVAQHDPENGDSVMGHRFVSAGENYYAA